MARKKRTEKPPRPKVEVVLGDVNEGADNYPTPRDEYILSPEPIALVDLYRKWKAKGIVRTSKTNFELKCKKENWVSERKIMQERIRERAAKKYVDRMAGRMESSWFDATRRHMDIGKGMQAKGAKVLFQLVDEQDIKASESIRMLKEGVDIERKALGLADQVVQFQFVQEVSGVFMEVVGNYVTDPDVIENIAKDVLDYVKNKASGLEGKLDDIRTIGGK